MLFIKKRTKEIILKQMKFADEYALDFKKEKFV